MVKALKKIILSLNTLFLLLLIVIPGLKVKASEKTGTLAIDYELDPTSNFYTQKEDTRTIDIVDKRDELLLDGYVLAYQNDDAILYFKKKTCGIALFDKNNGYTWFSTYEGVRNLDATDNVYEKVESGVSIEYYNVSQKGEIISHEAYFTTKDTFKYPAPPNATNGTCDMKIVPNGIDIDVSFKSYCVSFKIEIRLDGKKLSVRVPYESIKEEMAVNEIVTPYSTIRQERDYKLKSISLFPYFGSGNYEINGYSFIPDGSGALIRYNDQKTSTAYIKKLYGADYSFEEYSNNTNIVNNGSCNLPIYGVNHGYNQAAFLCEVKGGIGSTELHSYPYLYSLIPINTTFFKYCARDTFKVKLSQNTMTLLNEEPYPSDYEITYTFLSGNDANYVGMANCYRESLGLNEKNIALSDIPLRLELLGIDYKPGLFGKNYVKMTKYLEALEIIQDLEESAVKNFNVTYLGWNRGGYFTNSATTARTALLLGGKKKLTTFSSYLHDKGYTIDYTINPLVTSSSIGSGNTVVKRIGLSPFDLTLKSSLEQSAYYVLPTELSETITKRDKRYSGLGIDSLKIDNLNSAFSYRYKSNAIYRSAMIDEIVSELKELNGYKISTEKPNSYLLPYMNNYYSAYYESNKYIYETDSIPFMSLLLSGYVTQYMPNINYVSDYELAVLRMIEYNIYPSFIITKREAYDLRYTNYEYLNSTQYDLWKDLMVKMYQETNNALSNVINAKMISHKAVDDGVVKISYDNGVIIYINYNKVNKNIDDVSLLPYSYYVKGGN